MVARGRTGAERFVTEYSINITYLLTYLLTYLYLCTVCASSELSKATLFEFIQQNNISRL